MQVYVLWLVDRHGKDAFQGVYSTPEEAQTQAKVHKQTWLTGRHFVIYEATLGEPWYNGKRVFETYEVAHHADG